MIYLDWNATTPPHPEVLAAMADVAARVFANPASVHGPGRAARAVVEDAREAVAALLGFDPRDTLLTSGGTEANNLALASVLELGPHAALVVSAIEHPSVLRPAEALAAAGTRVLFVPPSPSGVVSAEAFAEALAEAARGGPVGLVSLQAVSHETGVLQPVAAVAELAHRAGARLHVDAVQAAGKLPPSAWEGADLVSFAAHKVRGPKGIGALATRPGVRLRSVLRGGAQEKGLRPGTQDPVAAAGLGVAAQRAQSSPEAYAAFAPLRDAFERELIALGQRHGVRVEVNGSGPRAPHVSNLSFAGWRSAELAAALDLEGLAVSAGSACSAGTAEPSAVIAAMVGPARAASAIRVSLGGDPSRELLETALSLWERVLRRAAPSP